jgi:hypothetical protein
MCLMKVHKVKYLNGVLRKLIMLIFLGLDVGFTDGEFMTINQELGKIISSQVGATNFRSNIQSNIVMGCKLYFF